MSGSNRESTRGRGWQFNFVGNGTAVDHPHRDRGLSCDLLPCPSCPMLSRSRSLLLAPARTPILVEVSRPFAIALRCRTPISSPASEMAHPPGGGRPKGGGGEEGRTGHRRQAVRQASQSSSIKGRERLGVAVSFLFFFYQPLTPHTQHNHSPTFLTPTDRRRFPQTSLSSTKLKNATNSHHLAPSRHHGIQDTLQRCQSRPPSESTPDGTSQIDDDRCRYSSSESS